MNIKKILFPKAKDRPKTKYLKLGFRRLGIPIEITDKWMKRIRPPSNRLGPYIYPIEFIFDKARRMILYDIGTSDMIYHRYLNLGFLYFKIHTKARDIKRFRIIPAPNTPSSIDFLDDLPRLRRIRESKQFVWDFFFSGWCSANGLRIKACKLAKAQLGDRAYCGLQDFKHHRSAPPKLKKPRMDPFVHWENQARSRINLALPGGSALPWVSFRHVELWGIGAAVFTYPPDYHVFGKPQDQSWPWIAFDTYFSNFGDQLKYFIQNDDIREDVAMAGREYFDQHYFPEKQAVYFVEAVEKRIRK